MAFESLLFKDIVLDETKEISVAPVIFSDLNLDKIVDAIVSSKKEYNLAPFFFMPLSDRDSILYRHEIMQDLERGELAYKIKAFTQSIYSITRFLDRIRKSLEDKNSYSRNYIEKGNLLNAAEAYSAAVSGLSQHLEATDLKSRGLNAFRSHINSYIRSEEYASLIEETTDIKKRLSDIQYCMLIKDNCIRVRKYEDEGDLNVDIQRIFRKFNEGATTNYRQELIEEPYAAHVEAAILELVAKLYPDIFGRLNEYCEKYISFLDSRISRFSREVQFYISYLEFISKFKLAGLSFCYPVVNEESKEERCIEIFDITLASIFLGSNRQVVTNDFYLEGDERIIVVTGPNQGGKTTFARAFGQLHYLSSLGCQVPGKEARLFIPDTIFTHFEREENIKDLNGKLQADLLRIKEILDVATPRSVIIINELLSSTSLKDAVSIGKKLMDKIVELDSLCLYVTFLDELSVYSKKNVSMASTVYPDDPSVRTFKIIRKPADGLAYAISIAEKYGLTYRALKERI